MAVRLDHHVARRQRLKLAARAQTLDRRQQPAGRLGGLHPRLGEVEDNDAVDDCAPADGGEPADCESADVGNCLASMAGRSLVMSCPPASPWLLEHCAISYHFARASKGGLAPRGARTTSHPSGPDAAFKRPRIPTVSGRAQQPKRPLGSLSCKPRTAESGRRGKTRDSRRDG